MNMLQLDPEIFLMTPLGEMSSFIYLDYGLHLNGMFIGSLCENGQIVAVSQEECKRMGNLALDIPDPTIPTERKIK